MKPYPFQEKVIERIKQSKCSDIILEAPTGSGKSVIAYHLIKNGGAIFTAEKILQDQYIEMFSDVVSLKGKSNYYCPVLDSSAASICDLIGCDHECEFRMLRRAAKNSKRFVINYSLGFIEYWYIQSFPKVKIAVFDEAHNVEDILRNSFSVPMNFNLIRESLEPFKEYLADDMDSLARLFALSNPKNYLKTAKRISYVLSVIKSKILKEELIKTKDELLAFSEFRKIHCKFDDYVKFSEQVKWIAEKDRIVPYSVVPFAKAIVSRISDKRVWMSATIGDPEVFARSLGIENFEFITMKHRTPVENRKVYFIPMINVNFNKVTNEMNEILETVEEVVRFLQSRIHQNGVIFSGNYFLSKKIYDHLKSKNFKVWTHNHNDREQIVEKFKKEGGILITSSLYQGVDFKYDISRWQLVVKIPFGSLDSNFIKKKFKMNPKWYLWNAAIKVSQFCGRSVRAEDDSALTIIIDSNFKRIRNFIPEWMKDSVYTFSEMDYNI